MNIKYSLSFLKHKKNIGNIVLLLLSFFFIFNSFFFAINTQEGIPPDENYHIGLSKVFSENNQSFFLNDSDKTYTFGLVSRTPFLYHYSLGKLSKLHHFFSVDQVLFMRLLNIGLGIAFLYYSYLFLKLVKTTYFERIFVFLMISHTTMLFFLFGSVSYDNLINLLAVFSFLVIYKIYKKFTINGFILWVIISCLGILTKFSYSPLVFLQFITILHSLYSDKNMFLSLIKNIYTVKNMKVLLGSAVVLSIFVLYFYLGNIFLFKSISPACIDVLTHEQCMQNSIYARNFNLKKAMNGNSLQNSLVMMTNYLYYVFNTQTTNIFHLFSHSYVHSHVNTTVVLPFLFFISFILSLHYMKTKEEKYFIFIIIFYFLIVFNRVYNSYLTTGIKGIAVQGRYLFPIIIPFYWLMAKNFNRLLSKDLYKLIYVLIILVVLNQLIYRTVLHNILLKEDKYTNHYSVVKNYNEVLYEIPRVRVLEF